MEDKYKYIAYGIFAIVVILAIIFKDKVKASIGGVKFGAENNTRRNHADVAGKGNKVRQGSNSNKTPANNTTKMRGEENELDQN